MASAKEKDNKKTMDVNAPGKAAPSPTSRPIIIKHSPMMGDPMVQKDVETDKSTLATSRKVVEPATATLGSMAKKVVEKSETKAEKPTEIKIEAPAKPAVTPPTPPAEEPQAEPEANKEPAPVKAAEPEPEAEPSSESSSEAEVDAVANQAADKKKLDQAAKADAERQAQISQLIAQKKYFVPLSVSHHKQNGRIGLVLLIVLVLAAAGAAFAYRQGFINF